MVEDTENPPYPQRPCITRRNGNMKYLFDDDGPRIPFQTKASLQDDFTEYLGSDEYFATLDSLYSN